jgi:hypothetical protein
MPTPILLDGELVVALDDVFSALLLILLLLV